MHQLGSIQVRRDSSNAPARGLADTLKGGVPALGEIGHPPARERKIGFLRLSGGRPRGSDWRSLPRSGYR